MHTELALKSVVQLHHVCGASSGGGLESRLGLLLGHPKVSASPVFDTQPMNAGDRVGRSGSW